MSTLTSRVLPFLALVCLASPLAGQEVAVPGAAEMDAALQSHESRTQADRAVVSRVLSHPQVVQAAGGAGLDADLERARNALPLLSGGKLRQAADHARALDVQLAGGQSMVISTTTIILVLLLIIIIILVAD